MRRVWVLDPRVGLFVPQRDHGIAFVARCAGRKLASGVRQEAGLLAPAGCISNNGCAAPGCIVQSRARSKRG